MQQDDLQKAYEELKSSTHEALKEIVKLKTWYRSYLQAYVELEAEYNRRNKFEATIQAWISELERWLHEQYKEELKRRAAFTPNQFLPKELVAMLPKSPSSIEKTMSKYK